MHNNELDNIRQDSSDNLHEQKEAEAPGQGTDLGTPENQQKVYSVGGDGMNNKDDFTPSYYIGNEYSYRIEDRPGSRGMYADPPRGQRKRRGGRTWVIALAIVALIIMSALAGFGGTLIANEYFSGDRYAAETTAAGEAEDTQAVPSNDSTVLIIKNNGSKQVETDTGSVGDDNLSLPDVVELVKDSVVEIATEISNYVGRRVVSGAGSGVIIGVSNDKKTVYIVTNNHVISGADTITVRLTNGNEYDAVLRGADSITDIAVLTITPDEDVTVAQLGSSASLRIGETVIAIGNPLGELGGTVTDGIISGLAREVEIDGVTMTLLQTNAAVNPGNSGGGLFNMKGELIGIVNAKSTGANIDLIGFAIPIDTAYDIAVELIEYGYITDRVEAGLKLVEINDTLTAFYYGVSTFGVYVEESKYTDEIKRGDRIVSVNSIEVSTIAEIKNILSGCSVGETITIRVSRQGRQLDVKLTLREYVPPEVQKDKSQ
ncbi:MAG: S1C family serine protease [Eubacteriales bacterium]